MNFADRAMLVALVALAIPLAIHLLYRRRARHVMFPTARFAERAHLSSMGRMWLKRAVLLGLRMAVVGLLVLALAGPRLGGGALEQQPASASEVSSTSETRPPAKAALRPIRILVVDAAGEAEVRVRSADLVVAAFAGPEATAPKQVARCRADEADPTTPSAALGASLAERDVVFWVGGQAPKDVRPLEEFVARGGGLVWIPAEMAPAPESALVAILGIRFEGIDSAAKGVTIDPAAYTSDLVAAFEGGTSGDLSVPVFRHRLLLGPSSAQGIRFRDGRWAIVERRAHAYRQAGADGRIVVLAVGPAPCWGDLAGRPEFVVLMHGLAEALRPAAQPALARPAASPAGSTDREVWRPRGGQARRGLTAAAAMEKPAALPSSAAPAVPTRGGADLTGWLILALAVVVAGESVLAALQSPTGPEAVARPPEGR